MLETATKNAEVNGPPQFQSFSHVSVPCRDLEEGIHFYTQVLRGKVRVKEAHFALIRIAGTDIGIGTEGCSYVERGAEYPHFAFFAGGEEMLQMKDWLTRCGVPSTNFWTRMGVEALMFFRDPSNNIIELYCEKGIKDAAELPRDRRAGTAGPLISRVSTTTNGGAGLADRLAPITPRALSTSSPGLELRTSVAPVTSPLRAGAAVRTSAQPQHRLPPWRRPKPFPRPFPPASRTAPVFSGNP